MPHGLALAGRRNGCETTSREGAQKLPHTRSTSAPYAFSFLLPIPLIPCRSSSVAGARSAMAASVASWKIT